MSAQIITSFVARRAAQLATVAPAQSSAQPARERYQSPPERRGSKYDETRELDVRDVAKLVRAELKALRGFKCAVRIARFSGGESLKVEVVSVPAGFRVLNRERLAWEREHPRQHCTHLAIFSDEAIAIQDRIAAMVAAYNRNASDTMIDYFDVRFYASVSFSYELTKAERNAP